MSDAPSATVFRAVAVSFLGVGLVLGFVVGWLASGRAAPGPDVGRVAYESAVRVASERIADAQAGREAAESAVAEALAAADAARERADRLESAAPPPERPRMPQNAPGPPAALTPQVRLGQVESLRERVAGLEFALAARNRQVDALQVAVERLQGLVESVRLERDAERDRATVAEQRVEQLGRAKRRRPWLAVGPGCGVIVTGPRQGTGSCFVGVSINLAALFG